MTELVNLNGKTMKYVFNPSAQMKSINFSSRQPSHGKISKQLKQKQMDTIRKIEKGYKKHRSNTKNNSLEKL